MSGLFALNAHGQIRLMPSMHPRLIGTEEENFPESKIWSSGCAGRNCALILALAAVAVEKNPTVVYLDSVWSISMWYLCMYEALAKVEFSVTHVPVSFSATWDCVLGGERAPQAHAKHTSNVSGHRGVLGNKDVPGHNGHSGKYAHLPTRCFPMSSLPHIHGSQSTRACFMDFCGTTMKHICHVHQSMTWLDRHHAAVWGCTFLLKRWLPTEENMNRNLNPETKEILRRVGYLQPAEDHYSWLRAFLDESAKMLGFSLHLYWEERSKDDMCTMIFITSPGYKCPENPIQTFWDACNPSADLLNAHDGFLRKYLTGLNYTMRVTAPKMFRVSTKDTLHTTLQCQVIRATKKKRRNTLVYREYAILPRHKWCNQCK